MLKKIQKMGILQVFNKALITEKYLINIEKKIFLISLDLNNTSGKKLLWFWQLTNPKTLKYI